MNVTQVAVVKEKLKLKNWGKVSLSSHQILLGGILLLSACLNLLLLEPNNYTNEYYAAAVKSMLTNWHNFFFNAYDPGGFISVDKPPVFLWLETASAWVFGYNGISILLPSALAGVGSVALLYSMVKRWFGPVAGLISAFALAITPISVVMNRHNNPESILIFFMLLGAWAISRATVKGRFSWLILAVAMMGVAFNVKMLEAFIVLPTFYLLYFLFANTRWWKRILQLGAATFLLAVISLSWAVIVDLTPADQRPYVGSSSNNSVMNLIFNYNGLNRIEGQTGGGNGNPGGGNPSNGFQPPANSTQNGTSTQAGNTQFTGRGQANGNRGAGPGNGGAGGGMSSVVAGQAGPFRMFDQSLAGEAGWLLPLALLGLLIAAVQAWRRFPTWKERKQRYQGLLLWGGWLITFMVVFSMAEGLLHDYYLVMLAPGVAALAGISIEALWHSYRQGGWQKWLLPLVLIGTAIFEFNLLSLYSDWNRTLAVVMIGVELVCAAALLAGNKWPVAVVVIGFLGLCAAPLAWSISAIVSKSYTNETLPTAVPVGATTSSSGFNQSNSNSNTLLNNLLNNWNGWLTGLVAGLIGLAVVMLALHFYRRQIKGRKRFDQATTLASAALVIMLGLSLALTALPKTASASGNTSPVSAGQIGNPQTILSDNDKLIAFLEANQAGRTYLLATSNSNNASPVIIKTGQAVMALGGFQGNDQVVTSQTFAQMVQDKVIRYVLLDSGGGGFGRSNGSQSATTWVQQNCTVVDSSLWSSSTSSTTTSQSNSGGPNNFQSSSSGQLYDCSPQG